MKQSKLFLTVAMLLNSMGMISQTANDSLKQNPRGVYRMTTIIGKMGEVNAQKEQYKVCTDSATINFILQSRYFIISKNNKIYNYTGSEPLSRDDESDLIYDSNGKHFTLKWMTPMLDEPDPILPSHDWCIEKYELGKYSPIAKELFDIIMQKIETSESNPFVGLWQIVAVTQNTISDKEWENKKKEYENGEIDNYNFFLLTPKHFLWYEHNKTGYIGNATYWGTDSLSDGIKHYQAKWLNGNDLLLSLTHEGQKIFYYLKRTKDKTPLFDRIASQYVVRDFNWFFEKAVQGDAQAQAVIGYAYLQGGEDIEQDFGKAYQWFSKAAEQEVPEAEMMMGAFYLEGKVVEQDTEKGLEWIKKAADHGLAHAQLQMGYYYQAEPNKNYAKAFSYMLKAAEQGHPEAQNEVGVMYADGRGTEKNDAEAIEWYKESAENGYAMAQENLASRYDSGNGVEKDPQKAFEWYLKAAEQGYASAQNSVAWKYYTADGVEQDYEKAFYWAVKSVEGQDPYGYGTLAELYYKGCGVAKDMQKAFELYSKGAELEDMESMRMLAIMYKKGEGTKKDKAKAAYWQRKYEELSKKQ